MAGFIEGVDRGQLSLLPESLDQWVEESNSESCACRRARSSGRSRLLRWRGNPSLRSSWHYRDLAEADDIGREMEGRFGKQDFVYLAAENVYRCPAGERLKYYYTNLKGHTEAIDGLVAVTRRYGQLSLITAPLRYASAPSAIAARIRSAAAAGCPSISIGVRTMPL